MGGSPQIDYRFGGRGGAAKSLTPESRPDGFRPTYGACGVWRSSNLSLSLWACGGRPTPLPLAIGQGGLLSCNDISA